MKSFFVKITLFLSCFAIGAGLVWGLRFSRGHAAGAAVKVETTKVSKIRNGKGLEVKFKQIVETQNGLAVEFEITNFENESYFYSSYNEENGTDPLFALHQLKINGREENMRWCGTGLREFELESGESIIFRVYNLSFNWQKNKSIEYGFYFRRDAPAEQSRLYWSEKLPVDDATARILLQEKEKYK